MFRLAETHVRAKADHLKLLGNRMTITANMSGLRDLILGMTAKKAEDAKRVSAAVAGSPSTAKPALPDMRDRQRLSTPGLNVDWANKSATTLNNAASNSPFTASSPKGGLAGTSIRDSFRKVQENNQKGADAPPRSAHPGAQALRAEILSKLSGDQQALRANKGPEFDDKWGLGNNTAGSTVAEVFDRRYNQQKQKLAHKKAEFQARMDLKDTQLPTERSSDRPFGSDGAVSSPLRSHFSSRGVPVGGTTNYYNSSTNSANTNTHSNNNSSSQSSTNNSNNTQREAPVRTRVTPEPSSRYNVQTGQMEVNVSALKAELLRKKAREEEAANQQLNSRKSPTTVVREVTLPAEGLTIRDLASKLSMRVTELTRKLEDMGVISHMKGPKKNAQKQHQISDEISSEGSAKPEDRLVDADSAELLVLEMGYTAKRVEDKGAARTAQITDRPSTHASDEAVVLVPRAPVVCVMGHVDHGKTTLLDTLRKLNIKAEPVAAPVSSKKAAAQPVPADAAAGEVEGVAGTEAGGITQKLSAFGVEVSPGKNIMFLDTPGHAAFSSMRNHGAVATDLVILVVAIDDGVRPQTIEALKMAQDARCSIIVVLNKVDKIPYEERAAARNRVLTQLLKHNLIVEEFGGDVQVAEVAGRTGEGIEGLMESLLLQAEVLELQAATTGQAEAVVLDAHVERGKGVVADVLIRWGALSIGDSIVVGGSYGKVKSMINDRGESIRTALPSNSVRLLGLRSLPSTGAEMLSVDSENVAKEIAERRVQDIEKRKEREEALAIRRAEAKRRAEAAAAQGMTAAEAAAAAGSVDAGIKINLVIKADGVGTLEALKQIVKGIESRIVQDISINVVAASVGDVSGSDIELVAASGGESLILAFNVGVVDGDTRSMAKQLDVNICRDDVIYRLEDELVNTMLSYLPKERILQKEGTAKVQQVFRMSGSKSNVVVAGLLVQTGRLRNKASHNSNSGNAGDANANAGGFVYRVLRNGKVVLEESKGVADLKKLKTVVHEVETGMECGLTLDGYTDFEEGDEIECLKVVWKAPENAILPGDSGTVRLEAKAAATAAAGGSGAGSARSNSGSSSSGGNAGADVQSAGKRMHAGRS